MEGIRRYSLVAERALTVGLALGYTSYVMRNEEIES